SRTVRHDHFEQAKDKIMMGAERKSMAMSEDEKLLTAYHEAGHAIVGRLVPDHDPVYKVTIIPRGRALGVTMFLPEQDKYSLTRQQIHSQLASLYGGRVAEELIFGKDAVTTGASNDIERASQLARNMVTKWGLSETMGPLAYGENEDEVFLGRSVTQNKHISDETHRELDAEVRKIIDQAYRITTDILTNNRDKLDLMADALMKYETIDVKQIDQIMNGAVPDPPDNWTEGGGRPPSGGKADTVQDRDDGDQPSGEPAPG
ncbi:MAG: ATP-dependent metalloprotease, partial [Pseudomonadota bacterium]